MRQWKGYICCGSYGSSIQLEIRFSWWIMELLTLHLMVPWTRQSSCSWCSFCLYFREKLWPCFLLFDREESLALSVENFINITSLGMLATTLAAHPHPIYSFLQASKEMTAHLKTPIVPVIMQWNYAPNHPVASHVKCICVNDLFVGPFLFLFSFSFWVKRFLNVFLRLV